MSPLAVRRLVSLLSSGLLHAGACGALWLWATPTFRERALDGATQPITLSVAFATFSLEVPATEPVVEEELQVEVRPERARVEKTEYFLAPAQRPLVESAVAELAMAPSKAELKPRRQAKAPEATKRPLRETPRRPPAAATLPSIQAPAVKTGMDGQDDLPLPRLVSSPPPRYPQQAIARRWEGIVWLSVHVKADGQVGEVRVATSSGRPILDAAALRTVQATWKFEPARENGRPVPKTVRYFVRFRL